MLVLQSLKLSLSLLASVTFFLPNTNFRLNYLNKHFATFTSAMNFSETIDCSVPYCTVVKKSKLKM